MKTILLVIFWCFLFDAAYKLGYKAGVESVPPVKVDVTKECVAWMFDANFVDAKNKICKGKV